MEFETPKQFGLLRLMFIYENIKNISQVAS